MDAPKPRVLLVDDEKDNLDALRRLLRKDFDVVAALSGEEALALLPQSPAFDVIVSDQRMPGMSGSEFLGKAQAFDTLATRILLTGFADLDAVIDAVNRGHIWRYIAKPWEPDAFVRDIRQAADLSRLERNLKESRRQLEGALTELQAKDWARERLLQILLHEFRTAPTILESLKELDPGGKEAPTRLSFIANLGKRFSQLDQDITSLMQQEREMAVLPKEKILLSYALTQAGVPFTNAISGSEPALLSHAPTLAEAFGHFHALLKNNSHGATPEVTLDKSAGTDLFLSFHLESPSPLLPKGLQKTTLDPQAAWAALLEPFVGSGDFTHHSTGLRLDTALQVRKLAALGARAEFHVTQGGKQVELLIIFRA